MYESGYLKSLFLEILFFIVHPNLYFEGNNQYI